KRRRQWPGAGDHRRPADLPARARGGAARARAARHRARTLVADRSGLPATAEDAGQALGARWPARQRAFRIRPGRRQRLVRAAWLARTRVAFELRRIAPARAHAAWRHAAVEADGQAA